MKTTIGDASGRADPPTSLFAPDTAHTYRCRDFLDDQQRLISAAFPGSPGSQDTVESPDGRMLVIQLSRLLDAACREHGVTRVFPDKYGSNTGECCLSRFRLVLDFLDGQRSEITEAGLADEGEPLMVREEFVDYLLNCRIAPQQPRIPKSVLRRFLDDWGHRWI